MSKLIVGIDPGTTDSGIVEIGDGVIFRASVMPNENILHYLGSLKDSEVVIEMVASYGMAVGKETFETVFWIGRFYEIAQPRNTAVRLLRRDIKLHLCGTARAKDANVRQAILDRFGGKAAAVGKKATPGPLYGVKSHCWQALAVALCRGDGVISAGM